MAITVKWQQHSGASDAKIHLSKVSQQHDIGETIR